VGEAFTSPTGLSEDLIVRSAAPAPGWISNWEVGEAVVKDWF